MMSLTVAKGKLSIVLSMVCIGPIWEPVHTDTLFLSDIHQTLLNRVWSQHRFLQAAIEVYLSTDSNTLKACHLLPPSPVFSHGDYYGSPYLPEETSWHPIILPSPLPHVQDPSTGIKC